MKQGKLFILSAPSGAGKTSIISSALPGLQKRTAIERVITYTSRTMRKGEREGHDYHFISHKEFLIRIEQGFFLEWSQAYGNYYGSPRSIKGGLESGLSYIAILDRAGAQRVLESIPQAILIWITIPDLQILRQRLEQRGTDSVEHIEKRMRLAEDEIEAEIKAPLYHHYLVNDNLERAILGCEQLVLANLGLEGILL